MNGYPKYFLPLFQAMVILVTLSGLLLIPALLVFRLQWDGDGLDTLMTLPITSGQTRAALTSLHAIVGWGLVWLLGAIWSLHIRSHWRKKENRLNGGIFLSVWAILVTSSLGIYYFGDADWSQTSSLIHVGLGLTIPGMLYAHRKFGKRSVERKSARQGERAS
ncbi:MAG: hypothetical protein R3219_03985 [Hydrogenovibrio sp.]|nr:hypothetical protein [Hydrogenovibrio sp.]